MDFVTIGAVAPHKGSAFLVFTDASEQAVVLDYETIYCKGVRTGRKFTAEQWEEILRGEEMRKARMLALKILTGRDSTSGALYKKLIERGISKQTAAETVARCIELHEIDDAAYAVRAARYCLTQKHYGVSRTRMWMLQKGIPREYIDQAIADALQTVDTKKELLWLIERRYVSQITSDDYREKNKAVASLSRRGYRIGEIQEAIDAFLKAQEDRENEGLF